MTSFVVELPPIGSLFITRGDTTGARIAETNIEVDRIGAEEISGRIRGGEAFVVLEGGQRVASQMGQPVAPLVLDGEWDFVAEDDNALVVQQWLASAEAPGTPREAYTALDADTGGWLPMTMGAWAFQLPAEPDCPYPIPVWYRIPFVVDATPSRLNLVVDGFAGSDWSVYVNGEAVTSEPARSAIDAQMLAIDITRHLRQGDNVIAVRLVVTKPTDGLLDLVKLTGDFAIAHDERGDRIATPAPTLRPASWVEQGYPYYSGLGLYRTRFQLPQDFAGQRVFLEPAMIDDTLEVIVNGQRAGIRLWTPYDVEITEHVQPGENVLELRVANTLINLLEAVPRPSGLAGPPKLVPYYPVSLSVPRAKEAP